MTGWSTPTGPPVEGDSFDPGLLRRRWSRRDPGRVVKHTPPPIVGTTAAIVIRFHRPDARQHGPGAFSDSAERFVFGRVATELDAAATRMPVGPPLISLDHLTYKPQPM